MHSLEVINALNAQADIAANVPYVSHNPLFRSLNRTEVIAYRATAKQMFSAGEVQTANDVRLTWHPVIRLELFRLLDVQQQIAFARLREAMQAEIENNMKDGRTRAGKFARANQEV